MLTSPPPPFFHGRSSYISLWTCRAKSAMDTDPVASLLLFVTQEPGCIAPSRKVGASVQAPIYFKMLTSIMSVIPYKCGSPNLKKRSLLVFKIDLYNRQIEFLRFLVIVMIIDIRVLHTGVQLSSAVRQRELHSHIQSLIFQAKFGTLLGSHTYITVRSSPASGTHTSIRCNACMICVTVIANSCGCQKYRQVHLYSYNSNKHCAYNKAPFQLTATT